MSDASDMLRRADEIIDRMKTDSEPVPVFIVLETAGGRDAVDGVHLDEAAATKRCEELNLRDDDSACVVAKYVRTPTGYLTKGSLK